MQLPTLGRHRRKALFGLAVLAAPLAAMAGNESRSQAFPLDNGLFEVVADFSENSIYWCGAGTYALNTLSQPRTGKIYVWQAPAPSVALPGQKSVRFGLQPPPGVDEVSSLTTDVRLIGNSLSVAQARETCNERTSSG